MALAFLVLCNNSIVIGKDKYDIMFQDLADETRIRKYPSKTSILSKQNLKKHISNQNRFYILYKT